MSLLEVTLAIGLSLAIAAAAMTQITMQTATIMHYKDVDYYAREVPRTLAALQNISRGAHTFRIGRASPETAAPTGPSAPLPPPTLAVVPGFQPNQGMAGNGNGLLVRGTFGGTNSKEAIIWLSDNTSRVLNEGSSGILDPISLERTFPDNRRDICISVRTNGGAWPAGWILNKNVSDMRFDIIPDSGGAVLMTVWKRMRGEAGAGIAYQMVLERR